MKFDDEYQPTEKIADKRQRIRLTVFLSLVAYDAISELQHRERRKTGRALPIWKAIDEAVIAYAKQLGITIDDK